MAITPNPYLSFPENNTREAMTFYGTVFGAEPTFTPMTGMEGMPDRPDLVMHSELRAAEITLMGADNVGGTDIVQGDGVTIAFMVTPDDADRGKQLFEALSKGGSVRYSLEPMPWGALYGEFTDRFGVPWAFNIGQQG